MTISAAGFFFIYFFIFSMRDADLTVQSYAVAQVHSNNAAYADEN